MTTMRLDRGVLAVGGLSMFFLALAPASAQPPSPSAPLQTPPVQVGVAAAVRGNVEITSAGAVGHIVQSGRPIFMGDVITTGTAGRLQILLLDETVFTIGPNSSIVIDTFVYDPKTDDGRIVAQVLKGAFRFVTGKIGHKEPTHMTVHLPAGTIGVRGTMVMGRVSGEQSLVVLLGPGPENNVEARIGRIEVSNEVDHVMHSVTIARPGYGTTIPGHDSSPTAPELIPPQILETLSQDLGSHAAEGTSREPAGPANHEDHSSDAPPASQAATSAHDQTAGQPPTAEQLQAMAEAGQIAPEQLGQMRSDMDAWQNGDEATRAALMEKYSGDDHGGSFADATAGLPDGTADMTSFDQGAGTSEIMSFDSFAAMVSAGGYAEMMAAQGVDMQTAYNMYQQYCATAAQDAAAHQTSTASTA